MSDSKLPPEYIAVPTAPVIYFDFVPTYGTMNGTIQVELATRALVPFEDGGVGTPTIETGRLRCTPTAAKILKEALEGALKMFQQPQAPPVAVGKMN